MMFAPSARASLSSRFLRLSTYCVAGARPGATGYAGALTVATSARISAPARSTASFPASIRFTNEKKSWNMSP